MTPEEKRERKRVYNKAWHAANRERRLAANKIWQEVNREKSRGYELKWRESNREKMAAYDRGRYPLVADRQRANLQAWRAANPDRARGNDAKRRARKMAAFVEDVSPAIVYERDGGICQICGAPIGNEKWHLDHRMPLARGGEHSYANIQLAHAHCNQVKWARVPA